MLIAVLGFLVLMAINVTTTHVFEEKVVFHAYVKDGKGVDTNTAVKVSGKAHKHPLIMCRKIAPTLSLRLSAKNLG